MTDAKLWFANASDPVVNPWWTTGITHTASSSDFADVQAAVDTASDGDRVLIPAGTSNWEGEAITLGYTKRLQIQGAGLGQTIIQKTTNGTRAFTIGDSRITGVSFFRAYILTDNTPNWRVDHCAFDTDGAKILAVYPRGIASAYPNSGELHPVGLIDHCTFNNCRIDSKGRDVSGTSMVGYQWSDNLNLGTADAVYIEDCTFTASVFGNVVDCEYGAKVVCRYCTMTDVADQSGSVFEVHGVQATNRAGRKWEFYENTIVQTTATILYPFYIRGGTGVIFNNTLTGTFQGAYVYFRNERCSAPLGEGGQCDGDSTWDGNDPDIPPVTGPNGCPCRDQIGMGQDSANWNYGETPTAQTREVAYVWGNTLNSAPLGVHVEVASADWIVSGREYEVNNGAKPGYSPYIYPHPYATVI